MNAIITEETLQKVKDVVRSEALAHPASDSSEVEIEVRFGKTIRGAGGKPIFKSEVSKQFFIQIKEYANGAFKNGTFEHTIDQIFFNQNETPQTKVREKYISYVENGQMKYPGKWIFQQKTNLLTLTFEEYFMRISVAREVNTPVESIPPGVPNISRDKKRTSYLINGDNIAMYRLDCTEVTSTQILGQTQTIYEVEIEILSVAGLGTTSLLQGVDYLPQVLYKIFQQLFGTTLLYTQQEKNDVINRINQYILGQDAKRFPDPKINHRFLAQARNIKARDLVEGEIIPKAGTQDPNVVTYAVTDKANGKRKFLVIDPSGTYLMFPPVFLDKIAEADSSLKKYYGTVLEGELISPEEMVVPGDNPLFMIYDIVSYAGNNALQNYNQDTKYSLMKRTNSLNSYAKNVYDALVKRTYPIDFGLKEHIPFRTRDEFYTATNKLLAKKYPYHIDGLIFTPNNFSYDTDLFGKPPQFRHLSETPDILKWKFPDELTIDLLLAHQPTEDGSDIVLYMGDTGRGSEAEDGKVPFTGNRRHPFSPARDLVIDSVIRSATTGTILELGWNEELEKLYVKKIRTTKTLPNQKGIVLDVWEDIHAPITKDIILGKSFGLQFRYHNRLKSMLYNETAKLLSATPTIALNVQRVTAQPRTNILEQDFGNLTLNNASTDVFVVKGVNNDSNTVPRTRTILNVGAGRGGDVNKWVTAGFTHVICVEPNAEHIVELEKRLRGTELKYLILPLRGQDVNLIVEAVLKFAPRGSVDVISYMLSLSFFFDSLESFQSIIDLTYKTLMVNGYFLAFNIDGDYVRKYFSDAKNFTSVIVNDLKIKTANIPGIDMKYVEQLGSQSMPTTEFNKNNYIYIDIPNSIVEQQVEWLADLSKLYSTLETINLVKVREGRADTEKFLSDGEIIYSSMYQYIIMKRVSI